MSGVFIRCALTQHHVGVAATSCLKCTSRALSQSPRLAFNDRSRFHKTYSTDGPSSQGKNKNLYLSLGIAGAVAVVGGSLVYYLNQPESTPTGKDAGAGKLVLRSSGEAGDKSRREDYSVADLSPGERSAYPLTYPDYEAMPDIPGYAPYVIIGAGTAAAAAFRGIRMKDPKARVLVIGEEAYYPYMRTPLSKELWYTDDDKVGESLRFKQWSGESRSIFHHPASVYCKPKELAYQEKGGVAVLTSHKVEEIDVLQKRVVLVNGWEVFYDKCLVATGGKPRSLKVFEKAGDDVAQRTVSYRGIEDFQKLDGITRDSRTRSVVIIGGGFLGSELACSLAYRSNVSREDKFWRGSQYKVVQVFPESGNMGRVLPEYLSKWTMEKVKAEGVQVIPEVLVTGVNFDHSDSQLHIKLDNGEEVVSDYAVIATGIDANTDLAETSGFEVDPVHGGFVVNAELEARSNVWVAGDAACFYDIKLGRRRVEHHDHAVVSGRLAGENMTGAGKPYWHQSMFWSDLGSEVSYEAIGICDATLPTVGVYASADVKSSTENSVVELHPASSKETENFGKGVVFYLKDKVVVGIVMWNVFKGTRAARKIIMDGGVREEEELIELAKLFNLYTEISSNPL